MISSHTSLPLSFHFLPFSFLCFLFTWIRKWLSFEDSVLEEYLFYFSSVLLIDSDHFLHCIHSFDWNSGINTLTLLSFTERYWFLSFLLILFQPNTSLPLVTTAASCSCLSFSRVIKRKLALTQSETFVLKLQRKARLQLLVVLLLLLILSRPFRLKLRDKSFWRQFLRKWLLWLFMWGANEEVFFPFALYKNKSILRQYILTFLFVCHLLSFCWVFREILLRVTGHQVNQYSSRRKTSCHIHCFVKKTINGSEITERRRRRSKRNELLSSSKEVKRNLFSWLRFLRLFPPRVI